MNDESDKPMDMQVVHGDALEHIERAQIDMQIATAHKFPRQMAVVKKEMLELATLDQETAASCFYSLKRKNSDGTEKLIQGPSARLAEIAVNAFGNIKAGAQIIGNDGKMITARAVTHDLQKNVCIGVEVKRRITDKKGRTYSEDMQVVTGNAACSIALRNSIFKVIPLALIKPIYEQARKVAVGDAKTLSGRRANALKAFSDMGVDNARVFSALGVKGVEDIGLAQLEVLIGIHTAIKDGDTTIDEQFPTTTEAPKFKTDKPLFEPKKDAKTEAKGKEDTRPPIEQLASLMTASHRTEEQVLKVLRENGLVDESLDGLEAVNEFAPSVIATAVKNWDNINRKIE